MKYKVLLTKGFVIALAMMLVVSLAACGGGTLIESEREEGLSFLFERWSGETERTLTLPADSVIGITYENNGGKLTLFICGPKGSIYQGSNPPAVFTVNAHEQGAYTVQIQGEKLKGTLTIDIQS